MPILGIRASGISGHLFTPIGYISGANPSYASMNKFNLIAETISAATISITNEAAGSASNSGVAGYRYGTTSSPQTACQKFAYSNDAVSNLANALPQARQYATGQSNSGTAGYITGGATSGFSARYKTIVKSPFSNDTFSTLGTGFTDGGNANAACSNNHTAGYTFGGYSDTTGLGNWINKITYSNDSISSSVATVPVAGYAIGALSNDGTAAYFGNGTGGTNALYKLLYSNDTRSTIGATLVSPDLVFPMTSYRYQTAGYWDGGQINATDISTIQKILFSNETRTTISATLTTANRQLGYGETTNNGVI